MTVFLALFAVSVCTGVLIYRAVSSASSIKQFLILTYGMVALVGMSHLLIYLYVIDYELDRSFRGLMPLLVPNLSGLLTGVAAAATFRHRVRNER